MTRIHRLYGLTCAVLLLLAIGCQPSGTSFIASDPPRSREQTRVATPDDSEPLANQVSVEIKSWAEVQEMVASLQGQVVVVDVWSTWCVPCIRKFPDFVKLHKSYPERVTCISVAANYIGLADEPPESFREEVLGFLREQNATFPNVISSTPDEELYAAIGASSVPIVLVYGPDGELKQTFSNDDGQYGEDGFTYADHIVPLVERLLAAGTDG
jgi:thiol-disulfide isomerase/thioredoxin